ncbi:hypothetical protein, partial [Nannocystis pusilla]
HVPNPTLDTSSTDPGTTTTTTDPGTSTTSTGGTTGPAGPCDGLDQEACTADAACTAIRGSPPDARNECFGPWQFLACIEATDCGQVLTLACPEGAQEAWLFGSTCIPDDFAVCDGEMFAVVCP